jgi:transposase
MLHASVTALLEALAAIERQIARLDEQLKKLARRSPVCWRLMSVPGSVRAWRYPSWRRPRT